TSITEECVSATALRSNRQQTGQPPPPPPTGDCSGFGPVWRAGLAHGGTRRGAISGSRPPTSSRIVACSPALNLALTAVLPTPAYPVATPPDPHRAAPRPPTGARYTASAPRGRGHS